MIYQRNIETMRRLGVAGWVALGLADPQNRLPETRSIVSDESASVGSSQVAV
jgi:hypothetical protein